MINAKKYLFLTVLGAILLSIFVNIAEATHQFSCTAVFFKSSGGCSGRSTGSSTSCKASNIATSGCNPHVRASVTCSPSSTCGHHLGFELCPGGFACRAGEDCTPRGCCPSDAPKFCSNVNGCYASGQDCNNLKLCPGGFACKAGEDCTPRGCCPSDAPKFCPNLNLCISGQNCNINLCPGGHICRWGEGCSPKGCCPSDAPKFCPNLDDCLPSDFDCDFALNEPPTSTISANETNINLGESIMITISATDDKGVMLLEFFDLEPGFSSNFDKICSGIPESCDNSWTVTPKNPGIIDYRGHAIDSSGVRVPSLPDPLTVVVAIPTLLRPSICALGGNDCDDNNAKVNPGKNEICGNGIDDNCNGKTDCQERACQQSDYYYQTGTESPTTTESCYLKDYYCDGLVEKSNDVLQYKCETCAYIPASSCIGPRKGLCSFYSANTQGPTPDQWVGGGNTQTAACGSADNDASSEYRDYHCTGTNSGEAYNVIRTKDCDSSDGWQGGGNNAGCGSDPNSVWNDYYVVANTNTCTSTTSCSGANSVNCDSQDICSNRCEGTVFVSVPPMKDYYVKADTKTCDSTTDSPVRENCATKLSTDSDGSATAYTVSGVVNDYTTCTLTGCSLTPHNDECFGNTLTEYGASGASYTSTTKNCEDYETLYCTGAEVYKQEWECSGDYCNDDAADTFIEDCDLKDGWYCNDKTKEYRNYGCSSGACAYTVTSSENCALKASSDSDGSSTAYTAAGTVTDYLTCSSGSCTSDYYDDICSGTVLTEYGASSASYTSSSYECQNFELNYCLDGRYYHDEWSCNIGACENIIDSGIGTNADDDAKDKECGDSLCDNVAGMYDSTKKPNEAGFCSDSLDNDCDGKFDADQGANSDPDCCSFTQSTETICDGKDNNCNGIADEGCDDDKDGYADAAMTCTGNFIDGNSVPKSCSTNSGDCQDTNNNVNPGKAEICTNDIDDNCNKDNDAAFDTDINTGKDCKDLACAGKAGPGPVICCQTASNCIQDDCKIESCTSNICSSSNRAQCDATECPAGQFCDATGGNCQTPDASSPVCLNCAPDQTAATWTSTNHQDAGKGFDANLFNSDAGPCSAASGGSCFDSNNNPVNHKSTLTTSTCCGDDANEYSKPDYYGAECTNDVNDCVWSTGDAQSSNTGNAKWWCFQHEWNECKDAKIGAKVGGVTCAGIAGNSALTPNSLVKREDQYSCTDSIDNDGDGKIDCADSDCAGTISGNVKDTNNKNVDNAKINAMQNTILKHTAFTQPLGNYQINNVLCGTYDMIASEPSHVSSAKTIDLIPNENKQNIDFTLVLGSTCEADCTYAGDNIIHKECNNINGCKFFDQTAADVCNLAQPGWIRDYSATQEIECAEGAPQAKVETKATVTCEEENLMKLTKLVEYKGKLVKLHIVVCG